MTFSSSGTLILAQDKTAGTTLVDTVNPGLTSDQVGIGKLMLVVVSADNIDTTDGETTLISVDDSGGNDYIRVAEFTNSQAAGSAGATVGLFLSVLTVALTPGSSTVTATFSSSVTAKAAAGWALSASAGIGVAVESYSTLANDAAGAGSMTLSGLPSKEYLFVRAIAVESSGTTYTTTTSYTNMTVGGADLATTTGGGDASNMGARGEFRILTGTTDTSNPTTSASDQASIYAALFEGASGGESIDAILLGGL